MRNLWAFAVLFLTSCTNNSGVSQQYESYLWHLFPLYNDFARNYAIDTNAHINIRQAWDFTRGAGVKIAVFDEGFESEHEDIKSHVILTYNAYDDSDNVTSNKTHGTTCAGFAAALDNDVGIIGVAPQANLLLMKITSPDGYVYDAVTIKAFDKAIQEGADVINCSWGSYNVSDTVSAKIQEAHDAGIVVVFAAGNKAYNLDGGFNDESELPWVIGVGASSEANDVTTYSDYGSNIDLIAPGGDTWASSGILGLDTMGSSGSWMQLGLVNENYAFTDGASFAAPQVAGVAALIRSIRPDLNVSQIRDILITTAQKVGMENNASYTNGFDTYRAYGKLDAGAALQKAATY